MNALRRSARVAATVLTEATALVALVAVGRRGELAVPVRHLDRLDAWLLDGDPATVVVAVVRWAALLGCAWLLGSTLAYLAAALTGAPRAVRAVGWSTLPAVRRTIDAARAASIATSVVLVPTAAGASRAPDPPSAGVVRDGRAIARLPADTTSSPSPSPLGPASAPGATDTGETGAGMGSDVTAPPAEVVVAPGDDLWALSAARIAVVSGRDRADVPDAEVAPYWVRVCETNREHLASRDPNLVYPGERILFPPLA